MAPKIIKSTVAVLLVIFLLLALALGDFVIGLMLMPDKVEPFYYRNSVGIIETGKLDYDYIAEHFGETVQTETESLSDRYIIYTTHNHPEHGKMQFKFSADNEDDVQDPDTWELVTITTYNPEHHFRDVHVGSTRWKVIKEYWRNDPVKGSSWGSEFFEGDWRNMYIVTFTYDENDVVTSIQFIAGM